MAKSIDQQRYRKTYSFSRQSPEYTAPGETEIIEVPEVFDDDFTVILSNGKSFGRYVNGDVVPAKGKTPKEVILMAAVEPLPPIVSISSSTTILFNQTSIANILNFSYISETPVTFVVLEWRRGGSGVWTTLTTNTGLTTYAHDTSNDPWDTRSFNYRYTVTNSQGVSAAATIDITPAPYATPTVSLSISETTPGGIAGESWWIREVGNISSLIQGSIAKNSPLVPITSYSVQYSADEGMTWSGVPGIDDVHISGNPNPVTVIPTTHNDMSLKSAKMIQYRVVVTDTYTSSTSSPVTILFYNALFFGHSSSIPATSADVRALTGKVFYLQSNNPVVLETGMIDKIFTFAIPSPGHIDHVLDLNANSFNITPAYVSSTFSITDAGGTSTTYNVYTMQMAIPYSDTSHHHQITF